METSRGDFDVAFALSFILLVLACPVDVVEPPSTAEQTPITWEALLRPETSGCTAGGVQVLKVDNEVLAPGEAKPRQTCLVGVRPEYVTLSLQTDNTGSVRNAFSGAVTKVIPRGRFFTVELDCGFFLATYVTA
jgi:TOBE domain